MDSTDNLTQQAKKKEILTFMVYNQAKAYSTSYANLCIRRGYCPDLRSRLTKLAKHRTSLYEDTLLFVLHNEVVTTKIGLVREVLQDTQSGLRRAAMAAPNILGVVFHVFELGYRP